MYQSLYNGGLLQSVTLKYGHLNKQGNIALQMLSMFMHNFTLQSQHLYFLPLFHRPMAKEVKEGFSGQAGSC